MVSSENPILKITETDRAILEMNGTVLRLELKSENQMNISRIR